LQSTAMGVISTFLIASLQLQSPHVFYAYDGQVYNADFPFMSALVYWFLLPCDPYYLFKERRAKGWSLAERFTEGHSLVDASNSYHICETI
jgi:hypothetical protein